MFEERIRQLRAERGLTQADVALEVGLSTRGYQDLELGRLPKYETLLRIADFYDVSVDWLMGRTQRREVWR
uniref:helix-turn-helix transcriptional regulator n=1 Tax=uncultured Flavonifractor sp. TaxID=1193534 RepID=UPI002610AB5E|nr:helix-turn-helix transcriptional regulator [uncultured Flavonifractor sp.]